MYEKNLQILAQLTFLKFLIQSWHMVTNISFKIHTISARVHATTIGAMFNSNHSIVYCDNSV